MFDSGHANLGDDFTGELMPPPLSVVDVELDPDRAAAELTYLTPGVEVGGGVGLLDPACLSQAGRLDLLVVLARQAAWIEALTQRTLAVLDAEAEAQAVRERPQLAEFAHLPDPAAMLRVALAQADARDSMREEIALALRVPSTTAATRITSARRLVDQLPATLTALSGGVISPLHARVLADRVDGLDPEAMVAVERRVLPRAGRQTVANFQRCLARAIACEQPKTAAQRHTDAAG